MMSALTNLLKALPDTSKALTALAGAAAVGFTAAGFWFGAKIDAAAQGTATARDSVQLNRAQIVNNQRAIEQNRDQYETIICILTLSEDVPPIDARRLCP